MGNGILVTGGAGYVGSHVCARLRGADPLVALGRRPRSGPWTRYEQVDLSRDPVPAAAMRDVDTVIHLAALTHSLSDGDDAAYARINVDGTRRVLEAARAANVRRVVFVSSVKAMGEGQSLPQDENAEPAPESAYGRTKLIAEKMVREGGFVPETVVLRLCLVYGPGCKGNLARMIAAVDRGRFPPFPDVGNRRAMVHVADAARAVALGATEPAAAGRTFIVGDGVPYATRDVYRWICDALGRPVPGWHVPVAALRGAARVGDVIGSVRGRRWVIDTASLEKLIGSAWYDTRAIRRDLGFSPMHDLCTAMPEIVSAYRGEGVARRGPTAGAADAAPGSGDQSRNN